MSGNVCERPSGKHMTFEEKTRAAKAAFWHYNILAPRRDNGEGNIIAL